MISSDPESENSHTLYVLQCKNDKFYVGKTNDLNRRFKEHLDGIGSEWTKLHTPIMIVETVDNCDNFDEDKYVLKYMDKYGIDNVRGGSFSTIKLDTSTEKHIQRMIRGSTDRCFKCNSSDHFANECITTDERKCYICRRTGHIYSNCIAKTDINGRYIPKKKKDCCHRCGRQDHTIFTCKYENDIFGIPCHYLIDNVRSESFPTIKLDTSTEQHIQYTVGESTNSCFKCDSPDHFANECIVIDEHKCYICRRTGHTYSKCIAKTDVDGRYISKKRKECCHRCGRSGHTIFTCEYENDIFGIPCHHPIDDVSEVATFVGNGIKKGISIAYNKISSLFEN